MLYVCNIVRAEKATDERSMSDNWDKILDICDKVKAVTTGPKDYLKAILKRMNHQNPHVAKQAVSVSFFDSLQTLILYA